MVELKDHIIEGEEWREYDFHGRMYRIDHAIRLSVNQDRIMHFVLDNSGIVHCVPAPGTDDCVLRLYHCNPDNLVKF